MSQVKVTANMNRIRELGTKIWELGAFWPHTAPAAMALAFADPLAKSYNRKLHEEPPQQPTAEEEERVKEMLETIYRELGKLSKCKWSEVLDQSVTEQLRTAKADINSEEKFTLNLKIMCKSVIIHLCDIN